MDLWVGIGWLDLFLDQVSAYIDLVGETQRIVLAYRL